MIELATPLKMFEFWWRGLIRDEYSFGERVSDIFWIAPDCNHGGTWF